MVVYIRNSKSAAAIAWVNKNIQYNVSVFGCGQDQPLDMNETKFCEATKMGGGR